MKTAVYSGLRLEGWRLVVQKCGPHESLKTSLYSWSDIQEIPEKVESEAQTGMCMWSTSTRFENPCGCTILDMPE